MQKRAAIEHPPTSERSQRYIGSNWRKTLNAYTFKQGNLGPFTNYERTTTLPSTSFALSFKVGRTTIQLKITWPIKGGKIQVEPDDLWIRIYPGDRDRDREKKKKKSSHPTTTGHTHGNANGFGAKGRNKRVKCQRDYIYIYYYYLWKSKRILLAI